MPFVKAAVGIEVRAGAINPPARVLIADLLCIGQRKGKK